MPQLVDELRVELADRAVDAPVGDELLVGVLARVGRRRRHTAAAVTAAALVVVAAAGVAVIRQYWTHSADPAAAEPSPSPSVGLSPSPTLSSAQPLFRPAADQPTVTFPYRPGYVPDGLGPARVLRMPTDMVLHQSRTGDGRALRLQQYSAPPPAVAVPEMSSPEPVSVQGKAGSLQQGGTSIFLSWPETEKVWLRVSSKGLTVGEVLRYAEQLQQGQLSHTEPLHFGLLPVGLTVVESRENSMTFAQPGAVQIDSGPVLTVMVQRSDQPGSNDGAQHVQVPLDRGYQLDVSLRGIRCPEEELVRFAAAVTVDLTAM